MLERKKINSKQLVTAPKEQGLLFDDERVITKEDWEELKDLLRTEFNIQKGNYLSQTSFLLPLQSALLINPKKISLDEIDPQLEHQLLKKANIEETLYYGTSIHNIMCTLKLGLGEDFYEKVDADRLNKTKEYLIDQAHSEVPWKYTDISEEQVQSCYYKLGERLFDYWILNNKLYEDDFIFRYKQEIINHYKLQKERYPNWVFSYSSNVSGWRNYQDIFNELEITISDKKEYLQEIKDIRSDGMFGEFFRHAAKLKLISAESIRMTDQGIKYQMPKYSLDNDKSSLPAKRKF